jgi:CHAT domain-containing protein
MAGENSTPAALASVSAETPAAESAAEQGACHFQLGRYRAAKPLLESALEAAQVRYGEEAFDLLPILNQLAQAYLQLGELTRARKCCERALTITETAFGSDSIELAGPLNSLATIYFTSGLLDKCYNAAERALTILQAALGDDNVEVALARDRLGAALAEMGACERARALQLRALAVLRTNGRKPETAATLANLASTYLATGALESALPLYQEALATARAAFGPEHEGTATYEALLGDYWAKAGDAGRALEDYRRALSIKRLVLGELHPEIAELLFKIGRTEFARDKTAGRDTLLQAVAVLDVRLHRPHLFAEICSFLARALAPQSAAIFFWKLAVSEIESMRARIARLDGALQRSFLSRNREDFRALGDVLIGHGRLPEAQHVLTMLKEHELFWLAQIDVRNTKVPLTGLEARWARRGWRLLSRTHVALQRARRSGLAAAGLRQVIEQAGKELNAEFESLLADFAASDDQPVRQAPVPPDAAKVPTNQIPAPGTALLQYMLAPDHRAISIILTTPNLQREYRIGLSEGELNRLVYGLREMMQNRTELFLPNARRLHDILIAPLGEALESAGVETLAFSLDGVLRYLPMAALHDGSKYLIERFALVLATHAVPARARGGSGRRAVGLGVSRPLEGCQPLIGVRDELTAVIRTAPGRSGILPGIIRLDDAFTADVLVHALSSHYSVIHIASHFVFAAARESSSYLLLGDGSKLTLGEFAGLRFDAMDLVVLSACNTAIGGGHHQNGHEIEGLGAVVRHQGANQVLATLWPVADMTTAAMMRAFYRNHYSAGLDAPHALRNAQLGLLSGAFATPVAGCIRSLVDPDEDQLNPQEQAGAGPRHPFFWAPYILMGAVPHTSAH